MTSETIAQLLTDSTCGEACWSAREDVCRCSCAGANHGCDRDSRDRPGRTCRVQGYSYNMVGIVADNDRHAWMTAANEIDHLIARSPMPDTGRLVYSGPQCYSWHIGDKGIPAFNRRASESAMKWPELAPYRDHRDRPYILWARDFDIR